MIMQSQTSSGEARNPGGLVRRLLWHHSLKPEVSNDGEDAADVAANDVLDDLDQAVNLEQDRAYKGKDEGPDNGHDNVEERNDGGTERGWVRMHRVIKERRTYRTPATRGITPSSTTPRILIIQPRMPKTHYKNIVS